MFGNGIGTLRVILRAGGKDDELWSLTGEAGNVWHQGQLTVSSSIPFQVGVLMYTTFFINFTCRKWINFCFTFPHRLFLKQPLGKIIWGILLLMISCFTQDRVQVN